MPPEDAREVPLAQASPEAGSMLCSDKQDECERVQQWFGDTPYVMYNGQLHAVLARTALHS